jgi:hypothetical protein
MSEIKARLGVIFHVVNEASPIPPLIRYELGYLQLRLICEVLAIASFTAHGEVVMSKKPYLRKKWQAGEILKGIEEIHPDFYPVPCEEVVRDGLYLEELKLLDYGPAHLSKDELISLYGICGDVLHRGVADGIGPRNADRSDLATIVVWHNKILNLLNRHFIKMANSNAVYVMMKEKSTGKVTLMNLERRDGGLVPERR